MTEYPVIEVFGPVIQGEGALAGVPTHFVRFGLCDFRCSWCDSMYAVNPTIVNRDAEKLNDDQIVERLEQLSGEGKQRPGWVTFSGGNPAIYDLEKLNYKLEDVGFRVNVETQGSRWQDWLGEVAHLTVSPKPPSSGMTARVNKTFAGFMASANASISSGCIKIVVFDDHDFDWALSVINECPGWDAYLSVGTLPTGNWKEPDVYKAISDRQVRDEVGERYRWLCDKVVYSEHPAAPLVRVLPQLHVTAYGHARGV